jgi:ribosomal RNA-processing protein 17
MGKKGKEVKKGYYKKSKRNTAVTFDEEDRHNYLQGMIGAKKRRREFYNKKMEQEQKETRKQERHDHKEQRREELQKAKDLL